MNPYLDELYPYPFQRLGTLLEGIDALGNLKPILLSLGEPKHKAPDFIVDQLVDRATIVTSLGTYPSTQGILELRSAIAAWISSRYGIPRSDIDATQHVLPVSGTREALFSFAQACISSTDVNNKPTVLMPNPFYQIYEGACLLGGAKPAYIECASETGFLPDFDSITADEWERCQLLYICTPGNPTGATLGIDTLTHLIELAEAHDFVIASDECYSEIYYDDTKAPAGLLQACHESGNTSFDRCIVFNSLSKRSNLPGLRSGFVAGDSRLLEQYLLYRTYHGAALPLHTQQVSALAWADENHVVSNRQLYRDKMHRIHPVIASVLDVEMPEAGFYLWPEVPGSDEDFTRRLFRSHNVKVLPGSYLARGQASRNPGNNRVRIALVATLEDCLEAAERIVDFMGT